MGDEVRFRAMSSLVDCLVRCGGTMVDLSVLPSVAPVITEEDRKMMKDMGIKEKE
jgi:hypothetical protein